MRASERLDPISGGMSSNCRHRAHMQTSRKRKQQPSFRCSRKVRGEHDALTKAAGYAQATTESLGLDGSHLAAAFGEIAWESSILDLVQQRRRIRVESLDRVCSSLVLLVINVAVTSLGSDFEGFANLLLPVEGLRLMLVWSMCQVWIRLGGLQGCLVRSSPLYLS